jgi:hypothetical protein
MAPLLRHTVLAFVAAASVASAGLAHAQATAPQAPAAPTAASGGTVAELQQLLAQKRLTELRTTYNGDYGTSLLLVNEGTTAYVALTYRKELWRVYKFASVTPAEGAYDTLARQTRVWAEDDRSTPLAGPGWSRDEPLPYSNSSRRPARTPTPRTFWIL